MNLHQRTSARRRGPLSPECEKPLQPNSAVARPRVISPSNIHRSPPHLPPSPGNHGVLVIETEKAKKEAVRVADLLVDEVNGGVQESFVNEKRIEMEIRGLAASIVRFMKQSDQWLTATHSINTAIKEIGDFENWMKTMEYDCKSITTAIHNIHKE
uniref:Biogenesis of lysosome-related organelles complex 1 subunit 1 n=1 Tax=Salix viminalis TaxID=40686 RepID=A0A6N2LYZ4_SALVM